MNERPRYRVGTSGWQYDHWRGLFYPHDLPKKRWFEHFASTFDCVELNNSFYRQPKDTSWQAWHDAAPPGFRFAVKANRYITHMKRFLDCEEPLRRFLTGAERLKGYLGPILFQTPPQFECNDRNLERLEAFLPLLPKHLRHVFEFRHSSWFGEAGVALLREHRVGFCVQDMPGQNCPVLTTAPHAYLRLHGVGQTYSGRYTDEALEEWARRLQDLDVEEVWVFFNNDLQGHAVENALTLRRILAASGVTVA